MKPLLLLTGVDGSGKSTLAAELRDELARRGERAVVVWAGLRPVLLKPFILAAKFLLVRRHDKFRDYRAHDRVKKAGMRRLRFTHGVYLAVLFIDYLPQVFVKVVLPRMFGRWVICDRYYPDLMLDYIVTAGKPPERLEPLVRFAGRLFPQPRLSYFVTVPPDVALARKTDIPAREYLEERGRYYAALAQSFGYAVVDGTRPPAENCRRILTDLSRLGIRP